MCLEVDDRDINNLIKKHSEDLTTNELLQFQEQQHPNAVEEIGSPENIVMEKVISMSNIKLVLTKWQYVLEFVEKKTSWKSIDRSCSCFI